uniref:Ion transport domain-containing protein n=1 Tax=Chromera velia CCMP2878 TaxID=1169474 RepID=A0A0G4H9Z1_9ALVE|eukprot:Cvel_25566.t1-p1 / transcript=Cvel_25566.t1 / gene=Cvel_25566 / organism=Chromera_velia_CCMP2878 / gene_product=hypothetical protein / transcript_product=hypothetical protein / location=Cvel_scaffold2914:1130-5118(-) / protein_length=838 / sequence_SO=supercontig / SO=protein_coding / is_pseudo=false
MRSKLEVLILLWFLPCLEGGAVSFAYLLPDSALTRDLGSSIPRTLQRESTEVRDKSFQQAARDGNSTALDILLQDGADVHASISHSDLQPHVGWYNLPETTVLMLAAQQGHVEAVETLLRWNASATATAFGNWQPLHFAAQAPRDRAAAVGRVLLGHVPSPVRKRELLSARADSPEIGIFAETALHMAVRRGLADFCILLLEAEERLRLSETQQHQRSRWSRARPFPLKLGILREVEGAHEETFGFQEEVEDAIRFSLNATDVFGNTPLHVASAAGRTDIAALLLRDGAPVNVPRKDGATPLVLALRSGVRDLVESLDIHNAPGLTGELLESDLPLSSLKKLAGDEVQPRSAWPGLLELDSHAELDDALVRVLKVFEERMNITGRRIVGEKGRSGLTALQSAAMRGLNRTVTELLDLNADPQEADRDHECTEANRTSVPPLLLALSRATGADRKKYETTEMSTLRRANPYAILGDRCVLGCGGKAVSNRTALHCAASLDLPDLTHALLARFSRGDCSKCRVEDAWDQHPFAQEGVNSRDANGMTPLMLAAQQESSAVVGVLLECQRVAQFANTMDNQNMTALNHTQTAPTQTLLKALLEKEPLKDGDENLKTWDECVYLKNQCSQGQTCKDPSPGFFNRGGFCMDDTFCFPIENLWVTVVQFVVLAILVLVSAILLIAIPEFNSRWKGWNMQPAPVIGAVLQLNNLWTDVFFVWTVSRDHGRAYRTGFIVILSLWGAHFFLFMLVNVFVLVRFLLKTVTVDGQRWVEGMMAKRRTFGGFIFLCLAGVFSTRFFTFVSSNLFGLHDFSLRLRSKAVVGSDEKEKGNRGDRDHREGGCTG